MPPGLMSRRKSRHMVWEMGTGDWDGRIGNGNGGSRKVLPPEGGKGQAHNSHSPTGVSVV